MSSGEDDADNEKNPKEPEVLPPDHDAGPHGTAIYAEIVAQINKYTDRPDLFLETLERHDPGFIRRMNSEAETFSKKGRTARFNFGRFQAYTALFVSVAAALVCLGALVYMIEKNIFSFWNIIGLAIFYAITQGGTRGFVSLVEGVRKWFEGRSDPNGS